MVYIWVLVSTFVFTSVFFCEGGIIRSIRKPEKSDHLESRLSYLETRIGTMENNFNLLAETNKLTIDHRESLLSQLDVLTSVLKKQKTWLIDLKKLTKDMDTGDSELVSCAANNDNAIGAIAFTAFLDHDMTDTGADQTIIFNKIILNEGSAYNKHTGIFTCPRDGIYDFFFSIGQRDDNVLWAKLLVNSAVVVAASADAEHQYQDLQGSNRAVVRLNTGDVVRVVVNSGSTHLEGDIQRFTTFSGLLVAP